MSGAWPPPITEEELIERLALDDERFRAYMRAFIAQVPRRTADAAAFAWACAYPWARPAGSYLLADGEVEVLAERDERERERTIERYSDRDAGRVPLLAIGSNAASDSLNTTSVRLSGLTGPAK